MFALSMLYQSKSSESVLEYHLSKIISIHLIQTAQRQYIRFQIMYLILFIALLAYFLANLAIIQTLLLEQGQTVLIWGISFQDQFINRNYLTQFSCSFEAKRKKYIQMVQLQQRLCNLFRASVRMHYDWIIVVFFSQITFFLCKVALLFGLEQLIVFLEEFQHLSMSTDTVNSNCPIHQEAKLQLGDKKMILRWFIIDLQHLFPVINPDFPNSKQLICTKQLNQILFPFFVLFLILQIIRMNTEGRND